MLFQNDVTLFEANLDGRAAGDVDLMIITDECMKRFMHLWSVNNKKEKKWKKHTAFALFWGWFGCLHFVATITQNCPSISFARSLQRTPSRVGSSSRTTTGGPTGSHGQQLWRTLAVAVLSLRVSVGVLMLDALKEKRSKPSLRSSPDSWWGVFVHFSKWSTVSGNPWDTHVRTSHTDTKGET